MRIKKVLVSGVAAALLAGAALLSTAAPASAAGGGGDCAQLEANYNNLIADASYYHREGVYWTGVGGAIGSVMGPTYFRYERETWLRITNIQLC
jgi:hypothetical protein